MPMSDITQSMHLRSRQWRTNIIRSYIPSCNLKYCTINAKFPYEVSSNVQILQVQVSKTSNDQWHLYFVHNIYTLQFLPHVWNTPSWSPPISDCTWILNKISYTNCNKELLHAYGNIDIHRNLQHPSNKTAKYKNTTEMLKNIIIIYIE